MEFSDSEPVNAVELLTNVRDVISDGSVIAWKSAAADDDDGAAEQAKIEQLLFILHPSGRVSDSHGFIIFLLRENAENGAEPFDLLALSTDSIPAELQSHCIETMPDHLVRTSNNAIHVIVSTKSGLNQSLAFWQTVLRSLWDIAEEKLTSTDDSLTPPPPCSSSSPASPPPPPPPPSKESRSVLITRNAQSIREFARNLAPGTQGPESTPPPPSPPTSRTIVLLSGDGGVADILNGGAADAPHHQREQLSLALLPLGTANALFHSLHKPVWNEEHNPSPLVLGLRTLFKGVRARLPIFSAAFAAGSRIVTYAPKDGGSLGGSDRPDGDGDGDGDALVRRTVEVKKLYGAVVASYGFHASIVFESDTPEYRVHGDKRFGMVAQDLLKESHPYAAMVRARLSSPSAGMPGNTWERKEEEEGGGGGRKEWTHIGGSAHAYILVTPVSNLERDFTISPASKPLDGKLRLVHFGNVGGDRTMDVMMKAYDGGKHVGMKWEDGQEVTYEEIEELRVVSTEVNEKWTKVCIDGTIVHLWRGGFVIKKEKESIFNVLVDKRVLPSDQ